MPILDKPLEELRGYRGINPRPQDFDEYWDRALVELDRLGTGAELEPAEFRVPWAECFHLRLRGCCCLRTSSVFAWKSHFAPTSARKIQGRGLACAAMANPVEKLLRHLWCTR